jgi:opioid growth factor receptor-like protein
LSLGSTEGERIVAFYEGSAPDDRGRFLDDVLQFDDAQLETVHDFIQWLFPLPERSGANPSAPILDAAAIGQFHRRPELRAALRRSLGRMLEFYGFECIGAAIAKSASFPGTSGWLHPANHNHLRLTRILRSLRVLGETQAARALFEALSVIYDEERGSGRNSISQRSFQFWTKAVEA